MLFLVDSSNLNGAFSRNSALNALFGSTIVNGRCVGIYFSSSVSSPVTECTGGAIFFAGEGNFCQNGGTFLMSAGSCRPVILECTSLSTSP
ncbi:MAG: hypothetical protein FWG68_04400 [Defluviitaleaceae bacterium]|nr:hypothetical protein [Defluviitaleaceae bacterium]